MGFYEGVAPVGGVPREAEPAHSLGAVLKRSAEWTREMPGIVRGLYSLAAPFRWHLLVIFGFNAVIAAWETAIPALLEDPEFKAFYEESSLVPTFMPHDEYVVFIANFAEEQKAFMAEYGITEE